MKNFLIRKAEAVDLPALVEASKAMKAPQDESYFRRCLEEQEKGSRDLVIACRKDGGLLGYVLLNWQPLYPPFKRLGIPEVQDLNVLPCERRQGIGGLLAEWCEGAARAAGRKEIGIAVGLDSRYGAAQRLYVRRGYVPDGAGASYDDIPVAPGEMRPMDDLMTLRLVKSLD